MTVDRMLAWLQWALIASAPLLALLGVLAFVFVEAEMTYEQVYADGAKVTTTELRDPFDRWIDLITLSITALWQLGLGAAIFCLRRIALRLSAQDG